MRKAIEDNRAISRVRGPKNFVAPGAETLAALRFGVW